jgi:hypothetical protein
MRDVMVGMTAKTSEISSRFREMLRRSSESGQQAGISTGKSAIIIKI